MKEKLLFNWSVICTQSFKWFWGYLHPSFNILSYHFDQKNCLSSLKALEVGDQVRLGESRALGLMRSLHKHSSSTDFRKANSPAFGSVNLLTYAKKAEMFKLWGTIPMLFTSVSLKPSPAPGTNEYTIIICWMNAFPKSFPNSCNLLV